MVTTIYRPVCPHADQVYEMNVVRELKKILPLTTCCIGVMEGESLCFKKL